MTRSNDSGVDASDEQGVWTLTEGTPEEQTDVETYTGGVERLTYNNPYSLEVERIWYDGKVVYAVECGEVELEFDDKRAVRGNRVAQEYQVVYSVELDEDGKLVGDEEPERVPEQYNIYDSVPGMEKYSPLWQFNYVVVPRDYRPNKLRSEEDCLTSGYPIEKSTIVEN